jgi:hypothetical protein
MLGLMMAILLGAKGPAFLYEDPNADQLIRQAMTASYNLHFEQARNAARELENHYSDHPAGYTLMADTYWWEAQTDPGNQSIERNYYQVQETAIQKAGNALKLDKYPKVELMAHMAIAHGSRARFQVTQKQALVSALRAGLRAQHCAEAAYRLDPNYYDIWPVLGAFNYFIGSLPSAIKPLALLVGAHGDTQLGFRQLRTAIEKARYARTEAQVIYYTALIDNKQYPAAFSILENLIAEYADNFVFYEWAMDWFRRQNKNLEGADYFERLHQNTPESPLMAEYALLEKAKLQAAQGRHADALQTIARIKSFSRGDQLLTSKVEALEKRLRK